MIKRNLCKVTLESGLFSELTMTALRVFAGLSMAFGHGMGKVPPSEKFVEGVTELGFPMPEAFAWAAGVSEFAGGIFLALGLFTRPAAFFVASTMFVAGFLRHAQDPFKAKELALLYFVVALVFVARGAGKWSADRVLLKRL